MKIIFAKALGKTHASPPLRSIWQYLAVVVIVFFSLPATTKESPVVTGNGVTVIVVAGAVGDAEFQLDFTGQIETWRKVSAEAGAKLVMIGTETAATPPADRERLKSALEAEIKAGAGELWLVLVGHGTFDGKEAKFNLRGRDLSSTELAEWLKPFQRPLAIIDTSSASAPFLAKLAGSRRVVVSSTRSGFEQNYARFGKYFADAMADAKSDLDKDGQVSLLEAFLRGAQRTTEFYKTEGRLATEHALIDDNGDGLGTPAEWFRGVRAIKRARDSAPVDGVRAQQFTLLRSPAEQQLSQEIRERRDALELQIAELREAKTKMKDGPYFKELERLLVDLAMLYEGT
ncbi:MAG: hypothetical protein RIQ93_929 [Verrucomicrobiota bacterium]